MLFTALQSRAYCCITSKLSHIITERDFPKLNVNSDSADENYIHSCIRKQRTHIWVFHSLDDKLEQRAQHVYRHHGHCLGSIIYIFGLHHSLWKQHWRSLNNKNSSSQNKYWHRQWMATESDNERSSAHIISSQTENPDKPKGADPFKEHNLDYTANIEQAPYFQIPIKCLCL
jgi:hypothetical protein